MKIDELKAYVVEFDLDIIYITETWLNEEISNSDVAIENVSMYKKDRWEVKGGRAGGVIVYVRESVILFPCEELNKYSTEFLWCKMMVDKENVLTIGVCYNSPNSKDSEVNELMDVIQKASNNMVLIMREFNFPGINWVTLETDATESKISDLTQECFLTQHVLKRTRYDNILNLVLSSEENMVEELFVLEHLANSDQNIITWKTTYETVINPLDARSRYTGGTVYQRHHPKPVDRRHGYQRKCYL